MLDPDTKELTMYSNKVRARVCGLLREEDKFLLIKHKSLGSEGLLWSPPGGGIEFGESATNALKREFLEETNLKVEVSDFLFTYEMIDDRHHAIELFFEVRKLDGNLRLGSDPEQQEENQLIEDLRFFEFEEIDKMNERTLHGIFSEVQTAKNVLGLRGLFSFKH